MIYSDLRWAGQTGIGRYVNVIAERLPVVDLGLTGNKTGVFAPVQLWNALRRVARHDSDVLFLSMGFMLPIRPIGRRATFIYGLMQRDSRTGGSVAKRIYLDHVVRRQVRRCDAVFTISEHSKREIEDWVGGDDVVPIHNVGAGIEAVFRHAGELPEQRAPGYLLYVGSLRKTKRFDVVVASYASLPVGDRPPLVVVCSDDAGVRRQTRAAGIVDEDVAVLSGVDDRELARLYRGASASILLSESEGFGLPVAESLACGTRVVCSDIEVFSEISDVGLITVPVGRRADAEIAAALGEFAAHGRLPADVADRVATVHSWDRTIDRVSSVLRDVGWLDDAELQRSRRSDAST